MTAAIELLYADEHVVVADKPPGMLVHRGWAQDDVTAVDAVRDAVGRRVYPLHRLDRGTSGALLFALDVETTRRLSHAFGTGSIGKRYLALVRGHLEGEGDLDHPIPSREHGPRVPAVTSFRAVATSSVDRCSLVEAHPHTGRLHQLRRHLKHLTHPIVGDVRYGDGRINRHYRAQYGLTRLALHAYALTIPLADGQPRTVVAPIPNDLGAALSELAIEVPDLAERARQVWPAHHLVPQITSLAASE